MRTTDADSPNGSFASHAAGSLAALLGAALLVFTLVPVAGAQTVQFEIVVPLSTVVRAPEGSETVLSTTRTPDGLVGETCAVTARSENQSSVHPGNDLVVASATSIVLSDVEAEPGGTVTTTDTIVLSEKITITLIMGPDRVFSAGIEVQFDCPPEEITTTTTTVQEETTTTEEVSPTTEETTTTTEPTTTTTTPGEGTTTTTAAPTTTTPPTQPTVEDEVMGIEVLPFTGAGDDPLGLLALALVAVGVLMVVGARTEPSLAMAAPWRRRCAECDRDAAYQTPHGRMCFTHMRQALFRDDELWLPIRLDRRH